FIAPARPMRGIHHNGQVRELLDDRDGGDIEGVSQITVKGSDAALAQHDVVVPAGHDVFGGKEQLLNGGGDSAFQQNRLGHLAELSQQVVILHVTSSD